MKEATAVSEQFSGAVTSGAKLSAQAVVAASVKTTESLKLQAVAYREIAATAEKGSAEQIAAARLAEKAELKLAAAMGVVSAEATRVRAGTAGLGRDLERAGRGALSGTGIMHGFGRSLAFASGGFLAFEGASKFLTDSISAAREAGVAQRSLAAQMKASGESFAANREQIDRAALSYGKFGFQNDEVIASLTVLERGTGNINQAIRLQGLTADLARAKNLDLASAATVVAKVFGGQETALRRAVPGLERNAHGLELIRLAQAKLAGQAAANTTVSERFAATLHNTEEIVGTALLPILNQYLTSLSKWLDNMNRTGQLQRDVAGAVKLVTGTINAAKTALDALNTVTGSTKDTVKALFGVFVAFKTLRLVSWFDGLTGSIKGAGAAAAVAEGETAALSTGLGGLTAAPWVITVLVAYKDIKDPGSILDRAKTLFDFVKKGSPLERALENLPNAGPLAQAVRQAVGAFGRGAPAGGGRNLFSPGYKLPSFGIPAPTFVPHDLPTSQAALPIVGRAGLSPMQRAQLALSAAARTKSTKDDLAALVTQRQLLAKAIATETARLNQATSAGAAKKFADNLQSLQDKDAAAMNQIAGIVKKGAAQAGRTRAELAGQRNTWFDTAIGRMLDRVQDIPQLQGQIAKLRTIAGLIQQQIDAAKDVTRKQTLGDTLAGVFRTIKSDQDQVAQNAADAATAATERKATAQQALIDQLQFNVDRTDLTKGQQDNLKALLAYKAGLERIIATEGSTLALQQQLLGVELNINSKNQEIADAAKARRDAAKQAAQDARDAAAAAKAAAEAAQQQAQQQAQAAYDAAVAARRQRQFVALGLLPSGDEPIYESKLITQLKRIRGQVKGTSLDTKELEKQLAGVGAVLTNKFGVPLYEVGQKIQGILDGIDEKLKGIQSTANRFRHVSSARFVDSLGLNLTPLERERLRVGVARLGSHNTLPAQRSSQFTGGGAIVIHSATFHGVTDMREFEQQLTKRAKGRAHTRRGD